jgi:hydroxylaminobenzene mutase
MIKKNLLQLQSHKLIVLGFILFLLGLIIGFLVPLLANPRMGLSSHIEGILNGIFLIILGLIWERLSLSVRMLKVNFVAAVYGTFANWFGMFIAAIFNAGGMLNVAAEGKQGPEIIEAIINFLLISLSLAMVLVSILTLIGLLNNKSSGDSI